MREQADPTYSHGFIRAGVCIPSVRVAAPAYNADRTIELAKHASEAKVGVALFPELGISAYSNEDLFHQDALLEAVKESLQGLLKASASLTPVLVVGAPLQFDAALFNCAVTIHGGKILGLGPKTYLPNYREFYEKRQFTSGLDAISREVSLLGHRVPFGNDLIYEATNFDGFKIHTEICEDVWTPIPPSTYAALAGATVLANLSASNITVGKAEHRRNLCAAQSRKCIAAYMYSAAGPGESTTDLAWDGHALICQHGDVLAESQRFADHEQMITAEVDVDRLVEERKRASGFLACASEHQERLLRMRGIPFEFRIPKGTKVLTPPPSSPSSVPRTAP
jgi:NAD+ synthase (glutamine-hydrolysing)